MLEHLHSLQQKITSFPDPKITPSEEQLEVCHQLQTHNVVVDAIAGSGKTTTGLSIAAAFPDAEILLLTYNKRLKDEMRGRFKHMKNVYATNYHSYVVQTYSRPCQDDRSLQRFLDTTVTRSPEADELPLFDIIILDEVQDMSPLLFRLVERIFEDSKHHCDYSRPPKLAILGDKKQSIYDFLKADSRFLSLAPHVFGHLNGFPWRTDLKLSMSYRMTNQNAKFINECYLGTDPRLHACRDGPTPLYLWMDLKRKDAFKQPCQEIMQLVNLVKEYGAGNTFVLAPSIKNEFYPCRKFENLLSESFAIPTYSCISDDREINDAASYGKVLFSTMHQSKGMERELVLVFGVDDSQWNRYTSLWEADNKLYVALTRPTKQLVVVHDFKENLFRYTPRGAIVENSTVLALCKDASKWFDKQTSPELSKQQLARASVLHDQNGNLLVDYASFNARNFTGLYRQQFLYDPGTEIGCTMRVTDLLRFQNNEDLDAILDMLCTIEELRPALDTSVNPLENIPVTVPTSIGQCEEISDITGILFQHALEFEMLGTNESLKLNEPHHWESRPDMRELTKLALQADAENNGFKGRFLQMKPQSYGWIKEKHIELAIERASVVFGGSLRNEDHVGLSVESPCSIILDDLLYDISPSTIPGHSFQVHLKGSIDFVETIVDADRERLWEIKFIREVSSEHLLQLALYGYMKWRSQPTGTKPPEMMLYNIRNDQLFRLCFHQQHALMPEGMDRAVKTLLYTKFVNKAAMKSDKEFLQSLGLASAQFA